MRLPRSNYVRHSDLIWSWDYVIRTWLSDPINGNDLFIGVSVGRHRWMVIVKAIDTQSHLKYQLPSRFSIVFIFGGKTHSIGSIVEFNVIASAELVWLETEIVHCIAQSILSSISHAWVWAPIKWKINFSSVKNSIEWHAWSSCDDAKETRLVQMRNAKKGFFNSNWTVTGIQAPSTRNNNLRHRHFTWVISWMFFAWFFLGDHQFWNFTARHALFIWVSLKNLLWNSAKWPTNGMTKW